MTADPATGPRRVTREDQQRRELLEAKLRAEKHEAWLREQWLHKPCPNHCHPCPALASVQEEPEEWETVLPGCIGVAAFLGPDWKDRCTCEVRTRQNRNTAMPGYV